MHGYRRTAPAKDASRLALGGTLVTASGGPVTVGRTSKVRVVVRDPDGHFVELLQPDTLPAGSAPGPSDARIRLTVDS